MQELPGKAVLTLFKGHELEIYKTFNEKSIRDYKSIEGLVPVFNDGIPVKNDGVQLRLSGEQLARYDIGQCLDLCFSMVDYPAPQKEMQPLHQQASALTPIALLPQAEALTT